jgi:hypothetical protein
MVPIEPKDGTRAGVDMVDWREKLDTDTAE